MILLELKEIGKKYGKKQILKSVNLSLEEGMILALLGPSGIGKSTILEIMANLVMPNNGQVLSHGKISFMFQDDVLIPWLSAHENLTFVLSDKNNSPFVASEWLAHFGLEKDIYPAAMSGGMKRRLSLARTFSVDRPVIILDEPFAFLDANWEKVVLDLIMEMAKKGKSIVFSGHTMTPLITETIGSRLKIIKTETSPIVIG
jgi:ABC-type multidrug transport system ATPase subunit